jgi:transcriptional regulator with AAA-type ATPase domain
MERVPDSTVRREDAPRRASGHPSRPHLFVILECGRPLAGGARYSLADVDEVQLGRAPARGASRQGRKLVVGIPDPMMSGAHARLVRAAGWAVTDLGSKNGTLVDGAPVASTHLPDGALLEMGSTLCTIRWLPTPPETPLDVDTGMENRPPAGMTTLLPSYAGALASLRRVMATGIPILLLGETGTGKELLARAAHAESRRPGAFVPVNCGAIPDTLVESQLFGHARGAFSGAVRDEPGLVRASDRGTLFLDEIGDLPAASQAALLRVLQENEVQSLGTTRPVKVDLRVVSATHRRIDTLAGEGFRTDLYARLAGYVHELPALRDRREDLGVVVAALLHELAGSRAGSVALEPEVGAALYAHTWPRNVRELRHVLSTALVFAEDGRIDLDRLPAELRDAGLKSETSGSEPDDVPAATGEDAVLKASLVAELETHAGNVTKVARAMGKTRMQIHRWMRRYRVDPASYRSNR